MGLQVLQAGSTLPRHKPRLALRVGTAGDQERGWGRGCCSSGPPELGRRSGWALRQRVLFRPRASSERARATHRGTRQRVKGQRRMTTEKIT